MTPVTLNFGRCHQEFTRENKGDSCVGDTGDTLSFYTKKEEGRDIESSDVRLRGVTASPCVQIIFSQSMIFFLRVPSAMLG